MKKNTVITLKFDSLRWIFENKILKFSETSKVEEVIIGKQKYRVAEVIIPAGPKAYVYAIGFGEKPNNDGQVLVVWSQKPVGAENSDESNVFDPASSVYIDLEPFGTDIIYGGGFINEIVILETFGKDTKDFYQLKIDYKIREMTTGTLPAFNAVMKFIQKAISDCLVNQ